LLPSAFEGLGVVLIEAQCAGLPCLASQGTIPTEACILPNFTYVSLKETSQFWAEKALESLANEQLKDRTLGLKAVQAAGRDIKTTAKVYEGLFL